MKTILHKANTRGHANHGWLDTYHTFSFARYNDPERMGFGVLRVLNDDTVLPKMGFDTHPHDNMEIVTIPLSGKLKHQDTMGNETVISAGEIQAMSAGTGIMHSEYNASDEEPVSLLQIWIETGEQNISPAYSQQKLELKENELTLVVSGDEHTPVVHIHQDASFFFGKFDTGKGVTFSLKNVEKNGVYVFLITGKLQIGDQVLEKRDGIGIVDTSKIELEFLEKSYVLIMEVPL